MSSGIVEFVKKQMPGYASSLESEARYEKFITFLRNFLPSEGEIPVEFNFLEVPGDGKCLFHAFLRFFGYMGWDLPNRDVTDPEYSVADMETYNNLLENLMKLTQDYCRLYLGDPSYVHDDSSPEYDTICSWFAKEKGLRVIVLEFDPYKQNYNTMSEYKPTDVLHTETIILLNFSHHFYLISPGSVNPIFDTKTIREIVGDYISRQV